MTGLLTVTGIVLATMPIGDYDKRLTILTKERGKLNAFAKGARRPNSALLACAQPFTFGEFLLYEGRTSFSVHSADVKNYFGELRSNMDLVCYGLYFCEFTDYMTSEGNEDTEILILLYQSLRALLNKNIGIELTRYIFELKLIALSGEAPQVFECMHCGSREALTYFSVNEGGMFCEHCRRQIKDGIHILESTVYTMQFILSTPVTKLYSFTVNDQVKREFFSLMNRYRTRYVEHTFKSLELLHVL